MNVKKKNLNYIQYILRKVFIFRVIINIFSTVGQKKVITFLEYSKQGVQFGLTIHVLQWLLLSLVKEKRIKIYVTQHKSTTLRSTTLNCQPSQSILCGVSNLAFWLTPSIPVRNNEMVPVQFSTTAEI